ncbi:portal protein [Paenibacillus donghaensis]|uniref:Portal protein n=2 Tax=Paenibacillus donghaensis TaxID=414771 RepID=A0A2Z2KTM5_9BACL|nr:portal protein [Paenibacillus donghaensis]
MLGGYMPVFSQFGNSIYASDIVQNCIDIIATEISKLQPRHIRTDGNGMQTTPRGNLNRLFKFGPNELMTTRDFLEKIIWLLYMNFNVFIYPVYTVQLREDGSEIRSYTALYPLNPYQVDYLQDPTGRLYVKMYFASGDQFTVPYSDLIHIRKRYSVNEIMGGGSNGQPDNEALLKMLRINDTVLQGIEKGIKTSMSIRGVLKIATMMDDESQRKERERFEKLMSSGDSGILPVDLKGEFTPISIDPKMVDKDTLDFLKTGVQEWFGVSLPMLARDYNDEQYQAFYESTLEPILIGLSQAFTKTIFTPRELDMGNEIVFFQRDMMYLSTAAKLNLIKTAGEQGLLSDNQKLALLGYPPLPDGNRITQSLNYVDRSIINIYQLNGANPKSGKAVKDDAEE